MNADAKRLVTQVLRGEVTPQTHAAVFDDDLLYFAVRKLESAELEWLLGQLKGASSPSGWEQVVQVLSPEHQTLAGPPPA